MYSTNLGNYRIKKVSSTKDDKLNVRFYIQYRSVLYGWRYLFGKKDKITDFDSFFPLILLCFAFVGFFFGISAIITFFSKSAEGRGPAEVITSILLVVSSVFVFYFANLLNLKIPNYIYSYSSKEDAEKGVKDRIEFLKAEELLKATETPSEIFYLDLKSERYNKLKRLNRNRKWF